METEAKDIPQFTVYARVHFENGSTHTICGEVKDEAEAREIALSGLESMTGLPRERLVRVTKVELFTNKN